MKRIKQSICLLAVMIPLLVGSSAKAEVVQTYLQVRPYGAVPANSWISCQARILVFVDRDPNGKVIGGKLAFDVGGAFYVPGASGVNLQGLNIREGSRSGGGPVVVATELYYTHSDLDVDFEVEIPGKIADVEALKHLLKNPSRFFVNLSVDMVPAGHIDLGGQVTHFTEYHATTVQLSPISGATAGATATGTITVHPAREVETGSVSGGFVNFTITYDFPNAVAITGVDLQNASSGENGPRLIRGGITEANPIISQTGKGTVNLSAPVTTAAEIALVNGLFTNPAEVYVNLRTAAGGTLQAQLQSLSVPPLILSSGSRARPVNTSGNVGLEVRNTDVGSSFIIDGQLVPISRRYRDSIEGQLPDSSVTRAGAIVVQVQNAAGVRSEPINIVVYSSLQSTKAVFVDAARFGTVLASGGIFAAFGSEFSTSTAAASSTALPTSLDGTSVFVDGLLAPLFYVSPTQVNFQIPSDHSYWLGGVQIVVLAKDGTASVGYTTIADTAPGIFTRLGNGEGAPSAYASSDGVNFDIEVSNPDGSPAPIDAGAYVSLYGTGIRYASEPVVVSIGGTTVTALFAGPHGTYAGLDQVNFQIPVSLATRGDVDLVIYVDGQSSNPVKLKIR